MAIRSRPIVGLRIGERLQAPEPPAPSWTPDDFASMEKLLWTDSTDTDNILDTNGDPVSSNGDVVESVVFHGYLNDGSAPSPDDVGPVRWRTNELYNDGSGSSTTLVGKVFSEFLNEGVGFIFGATVSWTGVEDGTDPDDMLNMAQLSKNGTGIGLYTGNNQITFRIDGIEQTVGPALNDGNPHSCVMRYNPDNNEAEYYIDGTLVGTQDDSSGFGLSAEVSVYLGDRRGVDATAWKVAGGEGTTTDNELAEFQDWLLRDVSTDGRT